MSGTKFIEMYSNVTSLDIQPFVLTLTWNWQRRYKRDCIALLKDNVSNYEVPNF